MAVGAALAAAKSVLEHLLEVGISRLLLLAVLSLLSKSLADFIAKQSPHGGGDAVIATYS